MSGTDQMDMSNMTQAKEAPGAADLAIGIVLTLFGAITLALSMTIQRYALAHPSPTIPYCGLQIKKGRVWGFGLLLYLFANVFKVVGLMYGPMTVLSSVFTTLLIFNLVIANKLLDERITPPKVAGAVLILIGAGLCTTATPEGIPENYSPDDVINLIAKPPPFGWFLIALMVSFAAGAFFMMNHVEKHYPIRDPSGLIHEEHAIPAASLMVVERRMSITPAALLRRPATLFRQESSRAHPEEWSRAAAIASERAEEEARLMAERRSKGQNPDGTEAYPHPAAHRGSPTRTLRAMVQTKLAPMRILRPSPSPADAFQAASRKVAPMPPAAEGAASPPPSPPSPERLQTITSGLRLSEFTKPAPNPNPNPPMPKWLDRLMSILYPASLGVDEALADLCVRAYSSMLATGLTGALQTWVLYVMAVMGTVAGVLSAVFFMPYVYRRYETTVALPIEYGALNAGNIASGLLFYGESQYMKPWQVSMALGGCAIILLGIGVGRLERLPCSADPNKQRKELDRLVAEGQLPLGGARARPNPAASPH